MPERIPQSVSKLVVFRAIQSANHTSPATGATIAITISKNGATSFSNPNAGATNATEMASGFYKFTLDTTDTGTQGPLTWRGAGSGVDDIGDVFTVVSANNAGFAGVPDAAAGANTGLPVLSSSATTLAYTVSTVTTLTNDPTGVTTLLSRVGTPSNLGGGATLAANLADIESQTDDIGAAGAGLTAITDILGIPSFTIASDIQSVPTQVWNNVSPRTITGTGTDAITATSLAASAGTELGTAVWASAARTLTSLDEDSTTLDLDATLVAAFATALATAMTEGYRGTGATGSVRDLLYEIIAHLGESSISGTTKTLKKLDGSTTAKTFTLDSATTPTSITETT